MLESNRHYALNLGLHTQHASQANLQIFAHIILNVFGHHVALQHDKVDAQVFTITELQKQLVTASVVVKQGLNKENFSRPTQFRE